MRVGIITGGTVDPAFVKAYCEKKPVDLWIGADHGMEALWQLGVQPACLVGDFDSVDPEILQGYREQEGIEWHQFRPEKDETDTELALSQALLRKPDEITVFGGTGTRLDHVLGTIHILAKALEAGVHCELVDPHNRIYLVKEEREYTADALHGPYVSFLPFAGVVKGVTLEGFKYPLQDFDVQPGSSLTVSNELTAEKARLQIREGVLICIEARD